MMPSLSAFGSIFNCGATTLTIASMLRSARFFAVGLLRNTYLKPRPVMVSATAPSSK